LKNWGYDNMGWASSIYIQLIKALGANFRLPPHEYKIGDTQVRQWVLRAYGVDPDSSVQCPGSDNQCSGKQCCPPTNGISNSFPCPVSQDENTLCVLGATGPALPPTLIV